jgi:hypothetical protein
MVAPRRKHGRCCLRFGRGPEGALNGFNGAIDEVRIYNRPLSGEEIKAHYMR